MNDEKQLQFVVDEDGNHTAVLLDIEVFHAMLDTIEELEDFYFSHHPEEREKHDAELQALHEEEQ